MKRILAFLLLACNTVAGQNIYSSEVLPSFTYLFANSYCTSKGNGLYGDTTLLYWLLPDNDEGYLYYAYSSVGGFISDVQYSQSDGATIVSVDNYVFPGFDTLLIEISISGINIESFCPFFVPFNPLPVTWGLIDFYQQSDKLNASAECLTESGSDKLIVQFSSDLVNWTEAEYQMMRGYASLPKMYNFTFSVNSMRNFIPAVKTDGLSMETHTFKVVMYGRFKQVDFNGDYFFTEPTPFTLDIPVKKTSLFYKNYDLSGRLSR